MPQLINALIVAALVLLVVAVALSAARSWAGIQTELQFQRTLKAQQDAAQAMEAEVRQ